MPSIRPFALAGMAAAQSLTGVWDGRLSTFSGGKFVLNHFDGARAAILEIVPKDDGSLDLTLKEFKDPGKRYTAVRVADAKAKGLPEPTNPDEHTRLKDFVGRGGRVRAAR